MTKANSNTDTRTLEGTRYLLTVKNKTNRLYDKGSLVAGTEVICLRKNESGYYMPCVAFVVNSKPQGHNGRITVDLYEDRSERVSVSPKAILWKTEPETCAECGLYAPRHHKKCGSSGMEPDEETTRSIQCIRNDHDECIRCACLCHMVECAVCDAKEFIGGEIVHRTLEDDGWYFGATETLCPDHSEQEEGE